MNDSSAAVFQPHGVRTAFLTFSMLAFAHAATAQSGPDACVYMHQGTSIDFVTTDGLQPSSPVSPPGSGGSARASVVFKGVEFPPSNLVALGLSVTGTAVTSVDEVWLVNEGMQSPTGFPQNATSELAFEQVSGANFWAFAGDLTTVAVLGTGLEPTFVCSVAAGATATEVKNAINLVGVAQVQPDGTPIGSPVILAPQTVSIQIGTGRSGNDIPLNNGPETVRFLSKPSVGAPVGTFPPDLDGDFFWGILAREVLTCARGKIRLDGTMEYLFKTDWTTTASFYDRAITRAIESTAHVTDKGTTACTDPCFACTYSGSGNAGSREPLFLNNPATFGNPATPSNSGGDQYLFISLGDSGLGNPCTIAPTLCSPTGGDCPPPGFVNGYFVEVSLYPGGEPGTGVDIVCNGVCDAALTYFAPGGMNHSGGTCGLGVYTLQGAVSTNETPGIDPALASPFGGFHLGGGVVVPNSWAHTPAVWATFAEPVLNVVADTGLGAGLEPSPNGGGALNGLYLSVGSGQATVGLEIRSLHDASVLSNVAVSGFALTPIPPPGIPYYGSYLLLALDNVFNATTSAGTATPIVFSFPTEGAFTGTQFPVAAAFAGAVLHGQGTVLDPSSLSANSTQMVTLHLQP